MKIVVSSTNLDKIREIKALFHQYQIYSLTELTDSFEIEEVGKSFKENALIKSTALYERLSDKQKDEFIVLSDDSGISVEALDFKPGIYSARYSKHGDDKANRAKLMAELEKKGVTTSRAFYSAAIALSSKFGNYCVHGFMYGSVIDEERGTNGFGYDSLFIPNGYDKTLGELDDKTKLQISHRTKALKLAEILLRLFDKKVSQSRLF
ncbi:RdgB/HAM1 family non-canonical purine NTP pyrophosphatase [uncultured Campylobacter sp.]|uniref:RdgB/HAM1 family non-canonical purine NTP pyrophosphatase n=1 Tax=uncultured Campylobacter sp. TaxID=218934 RepID=UPI0026281334|nr:RdgB/HAM1 family non-canonical purine NTP pyrophosphatase [uncultured Campylobacter sp.]